MDVHLKHVLLLCGNIEVKHGSENVVVLYITSFTNSLHILMLAAY